MGTLNLFNVIRYYKNLCHQNDAIRALQQSLTPEQVKLFYSLWYGDQSQDAVGMDRPDTTIDWFLVAYEFTKVWEGGFVDHPADPGGRTNLGVTQATYDSWRRQEGYPEQDVYYISPSEAEEIYRLKYWIGGKCDRFGAPLNIVMFDTCVNFGTGGGAEFLQEAVQVKVDGIIGPVTLKAVAARSNREVAELVIKARIDYRYQRVRNNPSQQVFLSGWLNRDNALADYIRSKLAPG